MRRSPLFPRRRPRTPSRTERATGVLVLLVLAGFVALFLAAGRRAGPPGLPDTSNESADTAGVALLPIASPGGWPRGALETYDADSLFEKINGKAGAYLAYGFSRLRFASYTDPNRPDASWIDVYLYEMATPLDALGIYRGQRSGREAPLDAGDEAVTTPLAVFGRRGPIYAEVMVADGSGRAEAEALVAAILDAYDGDAESVSIPAVFPKEGLERVTFDRVDAAGVEALRNAFTAAYAGGGRIVVARAASAEEASGAADEAREILEFLGERALVDVEGTAIVVVMGFGDDATERMQATREAVREETP